jgi:hypothetical protein
VAPVEAEAKVRKVFMKEERDEKGILMTKGWVE